MPRYLTALALVLSALPLLCHGQSLGDVAREFRADRQTSGSPQVITNDDLVRAVPSRDTSQKAVSSSTTEANRTGTPAEVATPGERAGKDSAKGREARELEIQRRTDEINQRYIDHIALLRAQINTAQVELVKLEGSYQNRWVVEQQYHKPDWDFRKNQILAFNQHITELTETQADRWHEVTVGGSPGRGTSRRGSARYRLVIRDGENKACRSGRLCPFDEAQARSCIPLRQRRCAGR